jgi:enoyl-[acyl-carrier protein] reductase I
MYNLLKGKRGIITGALDQNSIAWKVAEKAHEEGAEFVLTNAPIAMRMGEINALAEKTGSKIIPADATSVEDLTNLYTQSQEILGGKIDFRTPLDRNERKHPQERSLIRSPTTIIS